MDCNFCLVNEGAACPFCSAGNCASRYPKSPLLGSIVLTCAGRLTAWGLAGALMLGAASIAQALPLGGTVAAGTASITSGPGSLQINQSSQSAIVNWQSFSIAKNESVTFNQPNGESVILNRVTGGNPSTILGSLAANGKVFIVNPSGVLFAKGAQVNVGGLVASTMGISNADFSTGNFRFVGANGGSVVNQGQIIANGGYVALLGAKVDNEGVITAQMGSVVLASGTALTMDVAGNGLLNVAVSKGALNALVKNGGLIQANGGEVVLTAQAAGQLLKSVVNDTGVIEAQTVAAHDGTIKLLGDLQSGTVNVDGTLDASAPSGGNGGSIETSAAQVNIAPAAKITTLAPKGATGNWLIDPVDFTIGAGGNITGAALSALLVTNSVTISTLPGAATGTTGGTPPVTGETSTTPGNGDINVDQAVSWTASPSTTTLRLDAFRDVNINAAITATNGNLVTCCGRDVNVDAAITTTDGSVLLSGGRNVDLNSTAAITVTDGDLEICAGFDIAEDAAITLTRGTSIPAQSLGLPEGLVFIAGNSGTGPGTAGGTLTFGPLTPPVTVTGPNAPVLIDYNPVSYATPTNYAPQFTFSDGAALTEKMLVFPSASKTYDGTDVATLSGFNTTAGSGAPSGVSLVAGPGATATYDGSGIATYIGIVFTGYTLAGPDAAAYALADNCCVVGSRTTGVITAVTTPPPPPPPPPPQPQPPPTPTPTPTPPPPPTPIPTPTPTPIELNLPVSVIPQMLTPTLTQAPVRHKLPVIVLPFVPAPLLTLSAPVTSIRYGGVRLPAAPVSAPVPVPAPVPTATTPAAPAFPPKQDRF